MECSIMASVKDIIMHTDYESVSSELKIHYGEKHIQKLKTVYTELRNVESSNNTNNMILFIRVLKENENGEEDIVIQDFDNNDCRLMFDVCGEDDQYGGLYSIASSVYDDLLGYSVDNSTIERFTYSQIIAHILWEIEWK
jgi:hypothetical protein